MRGGGEDEDEKEKEKEPASSSTVTPPTPQPKEQEKEPASSSTVTPPPPQLPKAPEKVVPAAKKRPQKEDEPKTDETRPIEILKAPKNTKATVGGKVVITVDDKWKILQVTAINKDKTLSAVVVATGTTKEEMDLWTAEDRLLTIEKDSKEAIGSAEKQKFTAAHLDKLKIEIGKKKDVEATKMRVTEIIEALKKKKFLLSEI